LNKRKIKFKFFVKLKKNMKYKKFKSLKKLKKYLKRKRRVQLKKFRKMKNFISFYRKKRYKREPLKNKQIFRFQSNKRALIPKIYDSYHKLFWKKMHYRSISPLRRLSKRTRKIANNIFKIKSNLRERFFIKKNKYKIKKPHMTFFNKQAHGFILAKELVSLFPNNKQLRYSEIVGQIHNNISSNSRKNPSIIMNKIVNFLFNNNQ
jgi:hypothetical protein